MKIVYNIFDMQTQLQQSVKNQQAWVKIVSTGLEQMGLEEGEVTMATVEGNKIVIETKSDKKYRMFTDEEIEQWKKDDTLPPELAKETEDYLKKLGMP